MENYDYSDLNARNPETKKIIEEPGSEESTLERELKRLEQEIHYAQEEGLWTKIKKFIGNFLIAIILMGIAFYFVSWWAILIAVAVFPLTYFYTKYIHKTNGVPLAVVGPNDPGVPESGVRINIWYIPQKIWNQIKTYGMGTAITTSLGQTWVAEQFDYDPKEKTMKIIFQWHQLQTLNFIRNFSTFHKARAMLIGDEAIIDEYQALGEAKAMRRSRELLDKYMRLMSHETMDLGKKGLMDEKLAEEYIKELVEKQRKIMNIPEVDEKGRIILPKEEVEMQTPSP